MILFEEVFFAYEGIYSALQGVSLQIDLGESVAIMGKNGAGKTTLIKHLNGLLRPQRGRVIINGEDAASKSVAELSRIVGLVWQNPDHQLFLESVEKEIKFSLKSLGYSGSEAEERYQRVITTLGISHLAKRSPFALSGGERKRVALASVLATEPQVLALDEPTIGQDAGQKRRLAELLRAMNQEGRTVIVVTHDIEFAVENFERTIAMAAGKIIADGPTKSVLSNEKVLQLCSLTPPQLTIAAHALHKEFPSIPERLTLLDELEREIVKILGGA